MRKFLILLGGLFLTGALSQVPCLASTVQLEVVHSRDQYLGARYYPILFRISISEPWYIHGTKKEGEAMIPTSLSFPGHPWLKVDGIRFPEPEKKKFEYAPEPMDVFSGKLLVQATISIAEGAPSGEHTLRGDLSYQACSANACMPPENVAVPISLGVAPEGAEGKKINEDLFLSAGERSTPPKGSGGTGAKGGLLLTLFGFFVGGIALNLTPCIYPLIPITVSYFGGRGGGLRGHALLHGAVYVFGLAITNSLLGLSAALSGSILGSALQHPIVLIFVAAVLVSLALSSFDLWEFHLPGGLTRLASRSYGGLFGTFFTGLTLGIVAAPCLGPFILGLLTYVGRQGDPFLGFLCFFVLSIGLGLPLAVLALFSGAAERLPLSGDWMVWIRKCMGWVLLAMAAYMIRPTLPSHLGNILLALVVAAAAIHLGWIDGTGRDRRTFSFVKKGVALALLLGAILYPFLPAGLPREGIRWAPYDQTVLSTAAREQKPVLLDFYADWCEPCRAMEDNVFRDPEVAKLTAGFVTVRVDLTTRQPAHEEILRKYRVKGVPTMVFLNREGIEEETLRIENLVDRKEFLERAGRLVGTSSRPNRLLP